jgi:hypothetical protein
MRFDARLVTVFNQPPAQGQRSRRVPNTSLHQPSSSRPKPNECGWFWKNMTVSVSLGLTPRPKTRSQTRKSKAAHVSLSSDNNVKQQRAAQSAAPTPGPDQRNTIKMPLNPKPDNNSPLGASAVNSQTTKKQNTATPAASVPAAPPSMSGIYGWHRASSTRLFDKSCVAGESRSASLRPRVVDTNREARGLASQAGLA